MMFINTFINQIFKFNKKVLSADMSASEDFCQKSKKVPSADMSASEGFCQKSKKVLSADM